MPDARLGRSGDSPRDLTKEERAAIDGLKRLAKRWPRSLTLFSAAGSLCVVPTGAAMEDHPDGFAGIVIEDIPGIPNDGGDPW